MKHISGSISRLLLAVVISMAAWQSAGAQENRDTLRTYGPRFGLDMARFAYLLADPSETGAEISVDFELLRNLYPVIELGYSSISEAEDLFSYSAGGIYGRAGVDYNLIDLNDRSQHHAFTFGIRYGLASFSHSAENIYVFNDYWGDVSGASYEQQLTGHWAELVAGVKAELIPNLFVGWSIRYKFLLNPDMDPLLKPWLVPGFGSKGQENGMGFSYSLFYKIPLLKK